MKYVSSHKINNLLFTLYLNPLVTTREAGGSLTGYRGNIIFKKRFETALIFQVSWATDFLLSLFHRLIKCILQKSKILSVFLVKSSLRFWREEKSRVSVYTKYNICSIHKHNIFNLYIMTVMWQLGLGITAGRN